MKTIADSYTDIELVAQIVAGDTGLYELIIRRNNPILYKIGRGYGFNHQDTEDLMQETFVSAFFNLSKFEGRAAFQTWLVRIMLNNCFKKKKSVRNRGEVLIEELSEHHIANPATMNNQSITKELGRLIESSLAELPEDYRKIFTLRELAGLGIAETAELTGISAANVKVRLNRAKNMLRKKMEKMYSADEIFEFNLVYCDRIVARVMQEISPAKN